MYLKADLWVLINKKYKKNVNAKACRYQRV